MNAIFIRNERSNRRQSSVFAKSRELAGRSECLVDLPKKITCDDIIQHLCKHFNLESLQNKFLIALNSEYCNDISEILELKLGDEIPSVADNSIETLYLPNKIKMNFLKITEEKLDVNKVTELVTHESCGAVSIFVGTTRDNFEDKQVLSLKYEAYHTMAQKTLNKICDEVRTKWPDVKHIAIHHRLGVVPIKESSVVIAISSPHRQESLEAVQFAIDELKRTVPIWKKEVYGGNDEEATRQPKRRMKRDSSHLNFINCCPINNETVVSKHLQQIRADENEIQRRINCFINRKREEINSYNVQDFMHDQQPKDGNSENGMTCARVNSTAYRASGSKSHLKVHRVKNESGPQTTNYKNALYKLMENVSPVKVKKDPDGTTATPLNVEERIVNAESHFSLSTDGRSKRSIFERLKAIEDKILDLETLSPEYSHFLNRTMQKPIKTESTVNLKGAKKSYTTADLDRMIKELTEKSNG